MSNNESLINLKRLRSSTPVYIVSIHGMHTSMYNHINIAGNICKLYRVHFVFFH